MPSEALTRDLRRPVTEPEYLYSGTTKSHHRRVRDVWENSYESNKNYYWQSSYQTNSGSHNPFHQTGEIRRKGEFQK